MIILLLPLLGCRIGRCRGWCWRWWSCCCSARIWCCCSRSFPIVVFWGGWRWRHRFLRWGRYRYWSKWLDVCRLISRFISVVPWRGTTNIISRRLVIILGHAVCSMHCYYSFHYCWFGLWWLSIVKQFFDVRVGMKCCMLWLWLLAHGQNPTDHLLFTINSTTTTLKWIALIEVRLPKMTKKSMWSFALQVI